MSEGFANPIIGGGGGLVYPSIHSPNYAPGTAGWSINKNGTAQFYGLTLDNGTELYYSTATPQLGTLILAVSGSNGVDSAGNHYLRGTFAYLGSAGSHPTEAWGLDLQFAAVGFYTWSGTAWTQGANITQDGGGRLVLAGAGTSAVDANAPLTVSGALTATGGTAASPTEIITDSWHNLSLAAGFTTGSRAPQYRLYPDSTVRLRGFVTLTANQVAGTVFATLPYAPPGSYAYVTDNSLAGYVLGAHVITAGASSGNLIMSPAGNNTQAIGLDNVCIPLD